MRLDLIKKGIAVILAILSVLYITPYSIDDVSRWLVGSGYSGATAEEKADMILDLYMNQDFIYLEEDSTRIAREFMSEFLIQIFSGEGDSSKVVEALNELPVYERGERDTSRESYTPDTPENRRIKQTMQKLVDASNMSEEVKAGFRYFTSGINDLYLYFLTTSYPNVFEFAGDYITDDGRAEIGNSGVYYDKESTLIYGYNNGGILQMGFDCRANAFTMQNPVNPWQRQYGFNVVYDILGNMTLIDTQTVRVRFDYNGKHKMFQFWKGNYTKISNGAEVAIYNRQENSSFLYDSIPDEEMLYMSMKLYHGDELVMENDREKHWWLTGYVPGPLYNAEDMRLVTIIEFTDKGMLDAFMPAASKAFGDSAVITRSNLTVTVSWQ